jgi:Protein of unknown function (DUF2442)/Domain of unknown function (DUF4160)
VPAVHRFAGLRVVIYPNDHRPAHVHVIGSGQEAVFILNHPAGPVELRENYGFSRKEIRRIRAELAGHLEHLGRAWRRFMELHDNFELANQRARRMGTTIPKAVSAHYDRKSGRIVIELSSRLIVSFSPRDAQGLEHARPSQLEEIEISPSGFGIHFPKLDADLYVPGLLEGFLGSRKWMATRLGQAGGQSRSRAKKAASRANGKLGGRPRGALAK